MQRLELDEDEVQASSIASRRSGIELSDDCARALAEGETDEVAYTNDELAGATADALQLFLNQIGTLPAADGAAGGRARASASSAATARRRS